MALRPLSFASLLQQHQTSLKAPHSVEITVDTITLSSTHNCQLPVPEGKCTPASTWILSAWPCLLWVACLSHVCPRFFNPGCNLTEDPRDCRRHMILPTGHAFSARSSTRLMQDCQSHLFIDQHELRHALPGKVMFQASAQGLAI